MGLACPGSFDIYDENPSCVFGIPVCVQLWMRGVNIFLVVRPRILASVEPVVKDRRMHSFERLRIFAQPPVAVRL